jgi:phenylpropionate dioxygenase-like ring-hydroxylating dioxygenase large terminal subunit
VRYAISYGEGPLRLFWDSLNRHPCWRRNAETGYATVNKAALSHCWHPVAYSHELQRKPLRAILLDEPLVLWRDSHARAHAFRDLCIHRGTALSLGSVTGDQIVCPYHGWRYEINGACSLIPQLAEPCAIPRKARAKVYRCLERYGLIWAALDAPRWPVPEVPELESSNWKTVSTGPFLWNCDSARQVENFTDFGHFPFVHPGLLGDPLRPVVPSYELRTEQHILIYEIVRPEATNTEQFPIFANQKATNPERTSRYQLSLPFTIVLRLGWGMDPGMVYFFASQPIKDDRCKGYCLVSKNYDLGQEDRVIQDFESVIFDQDRRIVESQRPAQVPFDLSAELHLRFDAVSVAYRRAMRDQGLI